MWRKLGVALIALVSTFSVVYAMNQEMLADNSTYSIGGDVYGRIGDRYTYSNLSYNANPFITANIYGMQKGDKIFIGEQENLGWQLISKDTYTSYLYDSSSESVNESTSISSWFSFANSELKRDSPIEPGDLKNSSGGTNMVTTGGLTVLPYTYSNIARLLATFNTNLKSSSNFNQLIAPRNLTREDVFFRTGAIHPQYTYAIHQNVVDTFDKKAFIPSIFTYANSTRETDCIIDNGDERVPVIDDRDLTYKEAYLDTANQDNTYFDGGLLAWRYFTGNNNSPDSGFNAVSHFKGDATISSGEFYKTENKLAIRPAVYLDIKDTVFSLSQGLVDDELTTVKRSDLNPSYTSLYNETSKVPEMKLRLFDDSMKLSKTGLFKTDDITPITKVVKEKTIKVHANANSNSSGLGVNTLSAIIFNELGEFVYYIPISAVSTGDKSYELSLAGIPIGKYEIGFVNEVYNSSSTNPANSSDISPRSPLEIVEPLSDMVYTFTPQPNESITMYHIQAGINNKVDTQVAITKAKVYKNEVLENPSYPVNYEVINSDGSSNTNLTFKKNLDGTVVEDSNGNAIIYAKKNLEAGIYTFRVRAYDKNNDPSSAANHGVDKNGNEVGGTDPGLISDVQTIIVYPSSDTIEFEKTQKLVEGVEKNWNTTDINSASAGSPITIGTGKLNPNPKEGTPPAFDSSMEITYAIKDIKLNGTVVASGNQDFQINEDTGVVTKKNSITYGKHEFTLSVNYKKDSKTVTIDKKDCSFYVDPVLYFVDEKDATKKITELTVTHDDSESTHNFLVLAKSDSQPVSESPNMKYRVEESDKSGKIEYIRQVNKQAQFKTVKSGTAYIEAYYTENGVEIVVARLKVIVSVDAIEKLKFVETPQNVSGKTMSYYSYQMNVAKDQIIGIISSEKGTKPITYVLSDTENFYLKDNPDAEASKTQKYVTDKDGNVLVYAKKDLDIGKYSFEIQAYDANNQPTFSEDNGAKNFGIDANGNKVGKYDKGLISVTYDIVVYPNETHFTLTQEKKTVGTLKEFYTDADINADLSKTLATIEFASDAKINDLITAGYEIDTVSLLNKGTSTVYTGLKVEKDPINKNKFYIKADGNVTSGTKEFDISVSFKKAGTELVTAKLTKASQSIYIPGELKYRNPDKTTEFLTVTQYIKKYNPTTPTKNIFDLTASETLSAKNVNVKYCIVKDDACDTNASTIIDRIQSNGTATITAKAPGTVNKEVIIRAYTEDTTKVLQTKKDIKIIIQPATQTLTWKGTNIQTTNNHVVKNDVISESTKHPTWELKLKFDEQTTPATPGLNEYTLVEAYDKTTVSAGSIGIQSNVLESATSNTPALDIEYTITYDLPAKDTGKIDEAQLKSGKLVILNELEGNATIVATAKATGDYGATINKDNSTTTEIETIGSGTLKLNVSTKPKVEFKKENTVDIVNGDVYAKGTNSLGTLSLDNKDITYTYSITKAEVLDEVASAEAKKLDTLAEDVYKTYSKVNFTLKKNAAETLTNQLYVNSAILTSGLPKGTYQVTIDASKTVSGVKEEAIPKVITIVVKDKILDIDKLKWKSKDSTTGAVFVDLVGKVITNTETKENVYNATLNKSYYKDTKGENGNFYVSVGDTDDVTLTGATIKYELSADSTLNIIQVDEDGKVTMLSANTKDAIVRVKATIKKEGYADQIVYLPVEIKKGESDFEFVSQLGTDYKIKTNPTKDGDPYVYEALLDLTSKTTPKSPYTFEKDKVLDVITASAPSNAKVTISIVDRGASMGNDVVKFKDDDTYVKENKYTATKVCEISAEDYAANRTSGCLVQIQHALNKYKGTNSDLNKIIIVAEVEESANYKAKKLEMPVNIMPALQTDFDFNQQEIELESVSDWTAVNPVFKEIKNTSKIGDGVITLYVSDPDSEVIVDPTILQLGKVNPEAIPTYKKGIDSIEYNVLVKKDDLEDSKTVYIYAVKEATRDYEASSVKKQDWVILKEGTSRMSIDLYAYTNIDDDVDTGFKTTVTYGDAYFRLDASATGDEDDPTKLPTYTYTIDPESSELVEIFEVNGNTNKNEFKALKAGTAYINVVRTADGQTDIKKKQPIVIKALNVKLKIADVNKKSGMGVVEEDYKFTEGSDSFLEADKEYFEITFSCMDAKAVEVITLDDGIRMVHDQLPISATFTNKDSANDVLANYKITNLDGKTANAEKGKLIVTEDESAKSWYEISEGSQVNDKGETIATTKGLNNWYNGAVDVKLLAASRSYDLIAPEDKKDKWTTDKFTVITNGNNTQAIYFCQSDGDDKDAITKKVEESIKIDSIAPKVTEIKATLTHTDNFAKLINEITFGTFMKPGEEVTIKTEDVQESKDIEVSTTNAVPKGITYKVYSLDKAGERGDVYVDTTSMDSDDKGKNSFILEDPGTYEVCVIVKDQAGNSSIEKCEKLLVKKINFDGDGDDVLDYLDPDDDGCPDIDIALTDEKGELYKINIDRDEDGVPDLNIDSDGDGIAEINVDTDTDGKPDLNLVALTKWEPTFCVTNQSDEYCTMKDIKPVINVDTGKDGKPDINIDTTGDMKADINIDINTNGKLDASDLNLTGKIKTWHPEKDYEFDTFLYDTQNDLLAMVNVSSTDQLIPDLNIDTDGDGLPDINIDANGDKLPETNIDGNGDGIPDYNLDPDRTGTPQSNIIAITEWKPDVSGKIDNVIFNTMKFEAKSELEDNEVKVEKPGGTFLPNFSIKVNDISDSVEEKVKEAIRKLLDDQEIKTIYDVSLRNDDVLTQPDGTVRVKLPYDESIINPKVIIELADGSFKEVKAVIEDGYLVYESDYLGKVSIVGDKVESEPEPDPEPKPDVPIPDLPKPGGNGGSTPDTSVKGSYTTGVGGAGTGDATNIALLLILSSISIFGISLSLLRKRVEK